MSRTATDIVIDKFEDEFEDYIERDSAFIGPSTSTKN